MSKDQKDATKAAHQTLADTRDALGLVRENYKIAELVDKDIVITGVREWLGRFGPCATIHLILDDEQYYCVTSATVVLQKLDEVADYLPLACKIVKGEEEYYDII